MYQHCKAAAEQLLHTLTPERVSDSGFPMLAYPSSRCRYRSDTPCCLHSTWRERSVQQLYWYATKTTKSSSAPSVLPHNPQRPYGTWAAYQKKGQPAARDGETPPRTSVIYTPKTVLPFLINDAKISTSTATWE